MSSAFHLSPGWAASLVATGVFAIVYPVALALIARRRLGVGWKYFGYGALIFFLFQVITRVPIVQIVGNLYQKQLAASAPLRYTWLAILVVTAALFEEVGRYIGYRWLMGREEKTWNKAVMYGLGHGGLESILLVGIGGLLTLVNLAALSAVNLNMLPAAQRDQVARQLHAIAAQPDWLPLLGGWERLWTVPVQVAFSVLVLQVFRRGNLGWLGLAILGHMVVDGVAVAVPQLLPGLASTSVTLIVEGIIAIFGLIAVWIIWALRERPATAQHAVAPLAAEAPGTDVP